MHSSRRRYVSYREQLKERRANPETRAEDATASASPHASVSIGGPKKKHRRSRSFRRLLSEFWGLLHGLSRHMLILVLLSLTISTLLGLVPLYGTKIVFDSVLRRPSPSRPAFRMGSRYRRIPGSY